MSTDKPYGLQEGLRSSDPYLLGVALWLLLSAALYARLTATPPREVTAFGGSVHVFVPAGWATEQHDDWFAVSEPTLTTHGGTLAVRTVRVPEQQGNTLPPAFVDLELARIEQSLASNGVGFRVLRTEERPAFGARRAIWTWYAMVQNPPHAAPGAAVLPVVIEGVDILAVTSQGRVFHVTASAPVEQFEDARGALRTALQTVRLP